MTTHYHYYLVDHQYLKELGACEEYLSLLRRNRVHKGRVILTILEKTGDNIADHNTYFNGKPGSPIEINVTTEKFGLTNVVIISPDETEYSLALDILTRDYVIEVRPEIVSQQIF